MPRLRTLAAALGPAYVRVSGTWPNSAFFQDTDAVEAGPTPSGHQVVLTRPQWAGVIRLRQGDRRQACNLIRHQRRRSRW
jgi:hypothetical protein